jgi:hypothetical protein
MDMKKYPEAEPVLREGISIYEQAIGNGYHDTWIARASLGACLFGLGETGEAERLANLGLEALARFESIPRNPHYSIQRVAAQFETVGRPDFAARYLALLEF